MEDIESKTQELKIYNEYLKKNIFITTIYLTRRAYNNCVGKDILDETKHLEIIE